MTAIFTLNNITYSSHIVKNYATFKSKVKIFESNYVNCTIIDKSDIFDYYIFSVHNDFCFDECINNLCTKCLGETRCTGKYTDCISDDFQVFIITIGVGLICIKLTLLVGCIVSYRIFLRNTRSKDKPIEAWNNMTNNISQLKNNDILRPHNLQNITL